MLSSMWLEMLLCTYLVPRYQARHVCNPRDCGLRLAFPVACRAALASRHATSNHHHPNEQPRNLKNINHRRRRRRSWIWPSKFPTLQGERRVQTYLYTEQHPNQRRYTHTHWHWTGTGDLGRIPDSQDGCLTISSVFGASRRWNCEVPLIPLAEAAYIDTL